MPTLTHHLYRGFALRSIFCKSCNCSAYILDGKKVCCNKPPGTWDKEVVKVEISARGHRKRPSWWQKREILEAQENKCLYCGVEFDTWQMVYGQCEKVKLHWDHRIPFDFLQANRDFVAACSRCNLIKSDKLYGTLAEIREYIRKAYEKKEGVSKR